MKTILLLMLSLLVSCQTKATSQPLSPSLATVASAQDFLTAREGLLLCRAAVEKEAADAQLIRIEGRWIERGGRSQEWSYHFISALRSERLIYEQGVLISRAPLEADNQSSELNLEGLDSDAVAALLDRDEQALSFPLQMTLSAGVWQVSSGRGIWRFDDHSGELLTEPLP